MCLHLVVKTSSTHRVWTLKTAKIVVFANRTQHTDIILKEFQMNLVFRGSCCQDAALSNAGISAVQPEHINAKIMARLQGQGPSMKSYGLGVCYNQHFKQFLTARLLP